MGRPSYTRVGQTGIAMSELDLLNLGRSITANEVSWFAQVITINFAMAVGIYYFLNRAVLQELNALPHASLITQNTSG